MAFFPQASPDLLRACIWVFCFGWLVSSLHLPLRWSAALAAVKVAIPFVYFAGNPFGWIHLADDLDYFYGSLNFLKMGFDPLSILADPRGMPLFMNLSGTGQHLAYPLWNLLGTFLFGPHYFSPVLLNVGASFVSGWCFFRILRAADLPVHYCRFALAFFLIHWDTLAWSSFLNLKDTLVVTLSLAMLQQCVESFKRPRIWRVAVLVLLAAAGFFLRFYAPVLVLAAASLHLILQKKSGIALVLLSVGFAFAEVLTSGTARLAAAVTARVRPSELLWGLPQFLLTPLPWNLSAGYEFLLIPAIFHLLLIVPALLTIPALWRQSPHTRVLLLYLLLVVIAFSIVPDNRGVRQRQMTGFVFIWMQFHALWLFARYRFEESSPRIEAQ